MICQAAYVDSFKKLEPPHREIASYATDSDLSAKASYTLEIIIPAMRYRPWYR